MNKINAIVIGGVAAAAQIAQASNEVNLPLKDLNQVGLNPEVIQEAYRNEAKVEVDWNEVMKVSADEEGKNINVGTLDGISVVVPLHEASAPFNKGEGLGR